MNSETKTELKFFGILAVSVVLGVVFALVVPFLRYNKNLPPPKIDSQDPKVVYQYILDNPKGFQFIDVRSKGEYETLHATSSVSFPIADMYEPEKFKKLDYNKRIFVICTSGRLAGVAYRYLEHFGYRNIVHIDGGMQGWVSAGLPAVSKNIFE
jgi:rhodanese-related sulfurtransferase